MKKLLLSSVIFANMLVGCATTSTNTNNTSKANVANKPKIKLVHAYLTPTPMSKALTGSNSPFTIKELFHDTYYKKDGFKEYQIFDDVVECTEQARLLVLAPKYQKIFPKIKIDSTNIMVAIAERPDVQKNNMSEMATVVVNCMAGENGKGYRLEKTEKVKL
ncbi:MAG: hypothetical protein KGV51_04135 [Moraxellaceae bacterium]|nr:hypothetical protein [Moraxellaceae bacterium]